DAIVAGAHKGVIFDRPRGFFRMDSRSLEMLSVFGSGWVTSPGGWVTSPGGWETSPTAATGQGGESEEGSEEDEPIVEEPLLSIAFDPALYAGTGYRPTLLLPNFSWGLATLAMAVAVDEAWFLEVVPRAAERRIVSHGRGFGDSPFLFDDASFPRIFEFLDESSLRIPLVVETFSSSWSTRPTIVVDLFSDGVDDSQASAYQELIAAWYATVAGQSTAPLHESYPFDQSTFDHITLVTIDYLIFSSLGLSAPVAAYPGILTVAGMPAAPLPPESDGDGTGVVVSH
ncbi:MAG: hypothetical protein V2A73_18875, partial [Pseudomonadota bacterium]